MKKYGFWIAALALSLAVSTTAHAQRLGAQVSFGSDSDLGIGARAEFDLAGKLSKNEPFSRAFLITQFDWYFVDCNECSYFELNPSVAVPIKAETLKPYLGAGLKISRFAVDLGGVGGGTASDTDLGVNLLGGLKFGLGNFDAFTEARFSIGGHFEQLALSFGLLFGSAKK